MKHQRTKKRIGKTKNNTGLSGNDLRAARVLVQELGDIEHVIVDL
jgi:hypothetical protein